MALTILKEGIKVITVALYKTLLSFISRNLMSKEEAYKILDINLQESKEKIYKKYKDLYNKNSEENNGSSYLQSKIKNAYDFICKYK